MRNDHFGELDTLFHQPMFTALCRMGLTLSDHARVQGQIDAAKIAPDAELAPRRAAVARMAHLLSVSDLVSSARPGTLTRGGKVVKGCVVRDVQGVSLATLTRQAKEPGALPAVDSTIVQALNQLHRDILHRLFHDLLSERELDALWNRVEKVQIFLADRANDPDEAKRMKLVQNGDWMPELHRFANQQNWTEGGKATLVDPALLPAWACRQAVADAPAE